MIKNIIFDLSEVIISGYHNIEYVVAKHTDIKPEEFLKVKKEKTEFFLDAMRNKYTEDEYLEFMLENQNWNMSKEELKQYVRENMNVAVEGTMDIIKGLRGKYNLILLSDHIAEWVDYILDNNEELNIFDKKYFSYEYGKLKTDEGIFEYIIKDANIKPEETIFIDDSKDNVENAEKSGITGIVFTDAKDLEQNFKRLKIT